MREDWREETDKRREREKDRGAFEEQRKREKPRER